MDSKDQCYTHVWGIAGAVAVLVVLAVTFYNVNNTNKIAEMVSHGVNPLEAACSLSGHDRATCTLRAVK